MKILITLLIGIMMHLNCMSNSNLHASESLDARQQSIVHIAAFTSIGDLGNLKEALNDGLDVGLTINEIKEVLVHLYAYCGFPRSIRGLQTLMAVLNDREAKGIKDNMGNDPSSIDTELNKYERGKKILGELTKTPQDGPLTGYGAFAPVIDTFLKEHLFADIFERDVLDYVQRELVTISVLSSIGGVEPMLRGHFSICLNVGLSRDQLKHFVNIISDVMGKSAAVNAQAVLAEVIKSRGLD
jgi:alkylhydroperoxidase/carboxymuconolactone decarboxylase family protein YurZ